MVEIKARGAAKAEFTTVNEHFAATNNAEFGLFQQNLNRGHAKPLILGSCYGGVLAIELGKQVDIEKILTNLF